MNHNPPSPQKTLSPGLKNCCHHASPDDLTKLIHDEEPCFGTDKRYACADTGCQCRSKCHETAFIWLR